MSDFQLNGTKTTRQYMRDNGLDKNLLPRLASAVNVPIIHFSGHDGQSASSFTRRITQAQAESYASFLSTSVANLQTQNILTQLP